MFMDPHICMTLPEAVRVLRSVQAEGEALGAVLDERGEEGCEWAICLREAVQCAEWALRRWDLSPCLPARACVNAEQHHRRV